MSPLHEELIKSHVNCTDPKVEAKEEHKDDSKFEGGCKQALYACLPCSKTTIPSVVGPAEEVVQVDFST